jgi:hypothetical protein
VIASKPAIHDHRRRLVFFSAIEFSYITRTALPPRAEQQSGLPRRQTPILAQEAFRKRSDGDCRAANGGPQVKCAGGASTVPPKETWRAPELRVSECRESRRLIYEILDMFFSAFNSRDQSGFCTPRQCPQDRYKRRVVARTTGEVRYIRVHSRCHVQPKSWEKTRRRSPRQCSSYLASAYNSECGRIVVRGQAREGSHQSQSTGDGIHTNFCKSRPRRRRRRDLAAGEEHCGKEYSTGKCELRSAENLQPQPVLWSSEVSDDLFFHGRDFLQEQNDSFYRYYRNTAYI